MLFSPLLLHHLGELCRGRQRERERAVSLRVLQIKLIQKFTGQIKLKKKTHHQLRSCRHHQSHRPRGRPWSQLRSELWRWQRSSAGTAWRGQSERNMLWSMRLNRFKMIKVGFVLHGNYWFQRVLIVFKSSQISKCTWFGSKIHALLLLIGLCPPPSTRDPQGASRGRVTAWGEHPVALHCSEFTE